MNKNYLHELTVFVENRRKTPFKWGVNDCALFVADAVLVMTGNDIAKAFRGKYKSELGAAKALKKIGKGDLQQTLASLLGDEKPKLMAARGDICMIEHNNQLIAGVVYGGGVVTTGENGIITLPPEHIKTVWRLN